MIDKILIQLPDSRDEVVSLLPFLVSLNEQYPNSEKNIFMIEDNSEILNILPFKVRSFLIPEEVFESSLQIHKYCANLHPVFNIDLSIALNMNWKSALLGFAFRSRNRLGVKSFRSSPFLTTSLKMYNNENIANFADRLLSKFAKKTFQSRRITLPQYEIDDENFGQLQIFTLICREETLVSRAFNENFAELSEVYTGVKFKIYVLGHSEGVEIPLKMNANKKNYYEIITNKLEIDKYLQKISYSNILITDDSFYASMSKFLETPTVFFGNDFVQDNSDLFFHLKMNPQNGFDVEKLEMEIKHLIG